MSVLCFCLLNMDKVKIVNELVTEFTKIICENNDIQFIVECFRKIITNFIEKKAIRDFEIKIESSPKQIISEIVMDKIEKINNGKN